jgi:hypothetical protein
MAASSAREETLSFRKAEASWFATVAEEVPRSRAIAAFDRPASAASTTSHSARLRWGQRSSQMGKLRTA